MSAVDIISTNPVSEFYKSYEFNKNLPIIEKYDGNRWNCDDKNRVLNELFKDLYKLLDRYYYENESDLKSTLSWNNINTINQFIKSINYLDKSVIKPIIKDIYSMILQQK
jgi:hypothetical protein